MNIPVLNLSELETGNKLAFLTQLREAAHNIGFFYLADHAVPADLIRKVRELTHHFFALPESDKAAVSMIFSPHFRGYTEAGNELTNGKQDWREQFDIGAEREAVTLTPDDPVWLGLHGPNQWPQALPELKSVMLEYNHRLTEISLKLLRALSLSLSLPENSFDGVYGTRPNEHMKLIRYPIMAGKSQGVGAHKDSGLLTLILQDQNRGLQVELEKNRWIDISPIENTFVVNLGELIELATNGYLRATVHRVLSSESDTDRVSIAYFLGASLDSVVPVMELPDNLKAATMQHETDPNNPLLREVGLNYLKGRFRSHPDVARKFYSKWSQSV